jgi:Ser/Thr protein kinase RdoA (MazF antagonist)
VVFDHVVGVNAASMHIRRTHRRWLLESSGDALAGLQRALEGFEPDGEHHLDEASDEGHAWYLRELERLAGRAPGTDTEAELVARAPHLADRLTVLDSELGEIRFHETVIHGDFGLHNLLFTPTGTPVVHDFELARRDRAIIDIVIVVSRLPLGLRPVVLESFRASRPEMTAELDHLGAVWEQHRIEGAIRSWRNYVDLGSETRIATALRRAREAESVRTGSALAWS